MHEGKQSTELGLRGIPSATESIRLQRDLEILRYTGGRLHIGLISSKESVELIRKAKKDGLEVTCDVSAGHLIFNDEALSDFDPNFKVLPPYRTEKDRKALIKGLKDGTIDFIVSDHSPQDVEHKQKEFDNASFGASTIEGAFSACIKALGSDDESLTLICSRLSTEPKRVLGLPNAHIEEGQKADLSLFDPKINWTFSRKTVVSRSVHSPFLGKEMTGKVLGVIKDRQRKLFI
jgi:dihydroorotase